MKIDFRLKTQIDADIINSYKSLVEPNYKFLSKALKKNPYLKLLNQLEHYKFIDISDFNDDVSYTYEVTKKNKKWFIELSLIGSYAFFYKKKGDKIKIISKYLSTDEGDNELLDFFIEKGVIFLDKNILEIPIKLNVFNTEKENVCYYHALFSDTDIVPWKDK